jgi:hypothetical protein
MAAQETECASTASALAVTDGVVLIAMHDAQETDNAAAEMESVLKVNATATPDGLAMHAILEPVCMTALNTDIAITALVCAKKDIADVIAPFRQSPSHASVPFTAFVVVCSNAPRCTRPKELVRPMNVTLSAHKSVFPSVWLERCL